jgi:hypothetical protein
VTLQKDQDPGWWRRTLSKRTVNILLIVCGVVIITGLTILVINGVRLF